MSIPKAHLIVRGGYQAPTSFLTSKLDLLQTTVDWDSVQEVLELVADTIEITNPGQSKAIREWYGPFLYSPVNIGEPLMVSWFQRGYTVLRSTIRVLRKMTADTCAKVDYFTRTGRDQSLIEAQKRRIDYLASLQSFLVGCQGSIKGAFKPYYDTLYKAYPQDVTIQNATMFLDAVCLESNFKPCSLQPIP